MNGITQESAILVFVTVMGAIFVSIWLTRRKNGDEKMVQKKYNKDGTINQQWLAEEIARREAKIRQVDIAQIKEIWHVTREILHELYDEDSDKVQKLISKPID